MTQNRARPIQIKFFVDDKEKQIINKKIKLSNLNKSDYLRKMALDGFIIKQDLSRFDSLALELTRIDNRLEELIKDKNADKKEIKKLIDRLENIWELLRQVMK